MNIDPAKTGPENILTLVNRKTYPKVFSIDDFTLGLPRPHSIDTVRMVNTALDLYGNSLANVTGRATVYYHRVVLNRLTTGIVVEIDENDSIDDIFLGLVAHFGLVSSECRLRLFELPSIEYGQTLPIVLEANPNSLLYTGSINVVLTGGSTEHLRQLEDDTLRLLENGNVRYLETHL